MRSKAHPERAPRKTDNWRPPRTVYGVPSKKKSTSADLPRPRSGSASTPSKRTPQTQQTVLPIVDVALETALPIRPDPEVVAPAKSLSPPAPPAPSLPTIQPVASHSPPPPPPSPPATGRRRLSRACKDKTADAAESAKKKAEREEAVSSSLSPSPESDPAPTPARSKRSKAKILTQASQLPPEIRRLLHPTAAKLGDPTDKPGRGAFRSCDPCSKRREKCDRRTVCGSCIIHETVCVWSKCRPLYERTALLPGASSDASAQQRAEVDKLRRRVEYLASKVGLKAKDLLDPSKIDLILQKGLPASV